MDVSKEFPKFTFTRKNPNVSENRTPATAEVELLQQLVVSRRRYLAAIDDEIQATTALSTTLRDEIMDMERAMDEKKSILSLLNTALAASQENRAKILRDIMSLSNVIPVVRRLPDEILERIFLDAVWLEEAERRSLAIEWRSYSLGVAPLTLSRVCKRWRRIALGTPALWRFFNMVSVDAGDCLFQPAVAHWCQYASLDMGEIALDGWKGHSMPLPPVLTEMTGMGMKRRVYSRIEISCIDTQFNPNNSWPPTYPLAKEVVLISSGIQGLADYFLSLVSRAEKLVLSGIKIFWSDGIWDTLKDLKILGLPSTDLPPFAASEFLEIVTLSPQLERLDIQWDPKRTTNSIMEDNSPSVVHGELKELECPFEAIDTYLSPLQAAVVLPRLTSLTFKTLPFIEPHLLRGWKSVFQTITPYPLRSLILPRLKSDTVTPLLTLIKLLPLIEHLSLRGNAAGELIDRLIVDPESSATVIVPALTRIIIDASDISDDVLEKMVLSRVSPELIAQGVAPITSIDLWECPNVTPSGWVRISSLLKHGASVTPVRAPVNEVTHSNERVITANSK